MDGSRFDALVQSLTGSRRALLGGMVAAAGWFGEAGAGARRKRKRKHKKRKQPRTPPATPNAYGCLNVDDPCTSAEQCCSGICEGQKGERRCVAHDERICTVAADLCTTQVDTPCGTTNPLCACVVTTGNAPFCGDFTGLPGDELCRDCRRDADCQEEFGPGAACVVYSGVCGEICPETGRACVPACQDG
jgi:hypothetical protein